MHKASLSIGASLHLHPNPFVSQSCRCSSKTALQQPASPMSQQRTVTAKSLQQVPCHSMRNTYVSQRQHLALARLI